MSLTKKILAFTLAISSILIVIFLTSFAIEPNLELHDDVAINSIAPIPSALKSNRYTQMDDLRVIDDNPYTSLDGHELVGVEPVNNLAFYVHPGYLSLRIVNQNTGYTWASNMSYDYLHPDHELYNPDDIGSEYYLDPEYDEARNPFVREDRSPVVITYYNTLVNNNQRITEYFFENTISGQVQKTNLPDKLGFRARMTMPLSGIKFDMYVYLDAIGLHVEVPFDSIQDNNNFILSTMTLYRYFGFTKQDYTPGYVFIPDGIGALIRYDSTNTNPYVKKFYGPDFALNENNPEESLTASVFGLVQGVNQNALMVVVESGAGNATFSYVPANNIQTNFNRAQVAFEFRNVYTQRLNQSGTSTIDRVQAEKNPFDIHLVYQFLEGEDANYVGFANKYREYLIQKGFSFNQLPGTSKIPIYLDVLAAENKPVWYGRETFAMTTTNQLKQIINELKEAGLGHLDVAISGWQRGGKTNNNLTYDQYEGKFGSPWDLYEVEGIDLFYGISPLVAYKSSSGYSSNQVAQTQGKLLIGDEFAYLLKAQSGLDILKKNYDAMYKHGLRNIALIEFSNFLYSDYADGILTRSQTIEIMQKYLEVAEKTAIDKPYDYLWDADVISDLHMYSSQQLKFTDTVPFIPMVLSGFKHVYGRSSNFFANTSNELLRMIDYHVFPNFYLTYESANLLLQTNSSHIFTSRFADWKQEIIRQFNYVNDALLPVYNAHFILREVLDYGVVKNTYSNGVVIYINYTGNQVIFDGKTIDAISYEVVL